MRRRDPAYRIMNHLMNFAIDVAEKKIEKSIQQKHDGKYLPVVKDDVSNLVKLDRPNVYFDRDIGGLEETKEALKIAVIYPRTRRDLYQLFDKDLGNVLLYGPPGCGKTLLAKAVSSECGWDFISPCTGDIIKRHVGDRERGVSQLFEYCRNLYTNSVLFLDELESFMPRNGPSYVQRIKNEFQIQMDGMDSKRGFPAVIGATNKPWIMDTAMRRPGRFDKQIFVPPPDFYERKQILRISLNKLLYRNMIEGDFEMLVSDMAERTLGFSGADLVSLVDCSKEKPLLEAIKGEMVRRVRKEDFEDVLKTKQPSVNSWFSEAVRACRRYDEKDFLEEIIQYSSSQ